jgi:hypothetical protein
MILLAASSAHSGQQPTACIFAIVLDGSPTAQWDQIRKAAENIFKSTEAGDTVLLFEVRGLYTHLRFSCVKRCTDDELDSFYSALQATRADWFMHADLAHALIGPVYDKLLQHAGEQYRVIIIVLSEGDLSGTQAAALCKFADKVKASHGWLVLVTGTAEKINRELLIAAGKWRLQWCKLTDAADRALLEKLIQDIRPGATTIKQVTASRKETSVKPETAVKSPRKVQEARTLTEPNDSATKSLAHPVGNAPAQKEASGKETLEPNLASGSNAFKPQSSIAGLKTKASSPAKINHAKPPKEADLPASAVSGKREVKVASSASVEKTRTSTKENSKAPLPSKTLPFGRLTTRLLAIGGMSAISIIGLLLLSSWFRAKNWQKSAQNPVFDARRQQENQPKLLMARVGSSSYQLGNLSRFTAVHIGSSPENTIRINNKTVAPQHIRIYRRGDKLFARNLSKAEIVANGKKVRPRKRCLLTLPALVSIDRDVGVTLFLAKAASSNSRNLKESKNGQS